MELNQKQIQIIEIAEQLFSENGYDGTSVRNIAKAAGVNVAMISYYFGSKEKLLEALLFYKGTDFRIQVASILTEESTYLERVDTLIAACIRRIHANRRMYKIVHFEFTNGSRKVSFSDYLDQKLQNYKLIEDFVISGQTAGAFSKNINIPLIFPTILGTYFNSYYNKPFYKTLHNLKDEDDFDAFVFTTLTPHIQRTIKAILTYED